MINDEDIRSKLLILFILEKMEMPVNTDVLLQMCSVDNNWIPYLCLGQYVSELKQSGFINEHIDDLGRESITLSEDGKVCISHFFKDIYKSVRDDVTAYIRQNKLNYRKQQEFVCTYERLPDGGFKVVCAVRSADTAVFELSFFAPTMTKVTAIKNKWQSKALDFYRSYVDLLID